MQQAIEYLLEKETIFKVIIEQYGMPTIPIRPQGFETLVLLILEQQVSIDSAKATFLKLKSKEKNVEPNALLNLSDEEFRNLGVSRQKTSYIKALSTAILNKDIDLESLPTKTAQQVREELIKIKGIGNWTIDIYLMFCLQAPDLLPLGDIAVVNTIKELLDIHNKEEMEVHTIKWSPYRSVATYLLWHHYLNKRNRTVVY
ncbi:DNA-3-methyladenine glycosylase family protein [Flavobacterium gawalongense]|uniref:DNA-3-methyladenine glycosylase II n=1 Tax=Flavobacterium gawalongense TaxID=2594432 RepID=A0A553BUF5_9FLAO|nr:DNA-3-methyladenine glycosylase [Flavobacterium gawalongense]TRX02419.1 DNA-3-methyladenine glycosylase 2 family protein [Flavobacterium gawalongense]TRX07752.1 DNA-3-methyladenine glycosylase 2 family protein [Flavobacterium gawalongense]TRX11880.1 DNA-3-methyladenine glycosylase 2 family protein [Flavobacterium gawalongense]TRX13060.1 DNA-3-methyladenine glycosylase 2 family protein [Flavobacterium gawalongense]TRX30971.1 DNA-3-methyladenine glycosylase 2 family protein [Flavobacterium ga